MRPNCRKEKSSPDDRVTPDNGWGRIRRIVRYRIFPLALVKIDSMVLSDNSREETIVRKCNHAAIWVTMFVSVVSPTLVMLKV